MSKNITQNKTEFIQFRLDRDSKITAKALAEKYFDGKIRQKLMALTVVVMQPSQEDLQLKRS